MSGTVLVVEDTPANMKLAAMLLYKAGFEVLRAANAIQGIELARRHLPDLILMDMQLPIMDGLTATRLLKGDPLTAKIKIVALTACAMQGDEERMLAAGCDGYIAKPIRYQRFLDEIRKLLGKTPSLERLAHDDQEENSDCR